MQHPNPRPCRDSDKFTWPDEVQPNEWFLTRFLKALPGLPTALFNLSPLFLYRHRESVVQKLLKDVRRCRCVVIYTDSVTVSFWAP